MKKLFLCFFAFFLILSIPAHSQWTKLFNNTTYNSNDVGNCIVVDPAGNVYVGGSTYEGTQKEDYLLIKFNSSGDTLWTRKLNGTGNGTDIITAITLDNLNNVIVTGKSAVSGNTDYLTIKYSSSGGVIWQQTLNSTYGNNDEPIAVNTDDSANVYVTGLTYLSAGSYTGILTVKYNSNGVMQWNKYYAPGGNYPTPTAMVVAKSTGNIYISGYINNSGVGWDMLLLKYDRGGTLQYYKYINGTANGDDAGLAVAIDLTEHVFLTGYMTLSTNSGRDFATIKYNLAGDTIWTRYSAGNANGADFSRAITVTSNGNCYISGDEYNNPGSYAIRTIGYDFTGNVIMNSLYSVQYCGVYAKSILPDNLGNVIVCGSDCISGSTAFMVLKYNATNGNQLGRYSYIFPGTGTNSPNALAVDASGNAYMAGSATISGYNDLAAIKVLNSSIGISKISINVPEEYILYQNFPNPFNPNTTIRFAVKENSKVQIKVFDILGKEVTTLVNDNLQAGVYEVPFSNNQISSGIYFYTLKTDNFTETKKLVLLK